MIQNALLAMLIYGVGASLRGWFHKPPRERRVDHADDGDPLDWVLIDACPVCREMFGHMVGCPEMDRCR